MTLALCLTLQIVLAGLLWGELPAAAASDDDPLAAYGASLCLSPHEPAGPDNPASGPAPVDKACLVHCLGLVGSGSPALTGQTPRPAEAVLAILDNRQPQALAPAAPAWRSGLGARAPPVSASIA